MRSGKLFLFQTKFYEFLFDFIFAHTAVVNAVAHIIILKPALAGLIANWAVERMIHKKKFQNMLTRG